MPVSPAELHGHLLGRVCAAPASTRLPGNTLPPNCSARAGRTTQGRVVRPARHGPAGLFRRRGRRRHAPARRRNPLAQRTEALGQWCQGFLAGFGLTAREGSLTGEAEEVLQDMAAIAQVQGQLEDSEDGETDYMEVMEYLRVAPLLLFAECGKPLEPAPKPSLH